MAPKVHKSVALGHWAYSGNFWRIQTNPSRSLQSPCFRAEYARTPSGRSVVGLLNGSGHGRGSLAEPAGERARRTGAAGSCRALAHRGSPAGACVRRTGAAGPGGAMARPGSPAGPVEPSRASDRQRARRAGGAEPGGAPRVQARLRARGAPARRTDGRARRTGEVGPVEPSRASDRWSRARWSPTRPGSPAGPVEPSRVGHWHAGPVSSSTL